MLLKNLSIVHNAIFRVLYRFFLILQIICAVVLLSFPLSYANGHGATVLTVPVATDDFPDSHELETLLHHKTGLKEPRVYKYKAPLCYENVMQLTPSWLTNHYGTLPSSVRKESATQVHSSQYSLSQAIELIESDECQNDVSFVSVLDKKIANTLQTCNQLSLLPFQGTRKSSINLLEHEPFLHPLNYEQKKVPIILPITFNLWQKTFHHYASDEETIEQLSCMHKKLQSDFDKAYLTLPTHITFLEVSNKHHVEHLHQNMIHVSSVIIQTYGKQKVVLIPPKLEQYPNYLWLNSAGQFIFNKQVDFSASHSVLNNELRLINTTLYSIDLNPGDMLLVPANWFIYRKSLSTSISLSFNYLSGDQWRLFSFQAERMEQKHEHEHDEYLAQEKHTVTEWMNMETHQHPHNTHNIADACERIHTAINDATQHVLDLRRLWLRSLPNAIFRIPHLKTLHLTFNKLTSFSLSHVNNLVSLDLECNQLTSFSLNHAEHLVSVNVSRNQLTDFSLNHAEHLVSVNVSRNQLTSFSLNHAEHLVSVNVSSNQLTDFSLNDAKKLVSLDLSCNQLTDFSLKHTKNLTSLQLTCNLLTNFSLNDAENLGSLNLAYNQLTNFSLSHTENLTSLQLTCNHLTSFSLSHVENLISLNLEYNKLFDFSLHDVKNLDSLDLKHNHLTSFSLNYTENLKSLDLSFNSLISCSLGYAKKLASLNVAYNLLTSFSLPHMKNLTSLNLSFNSLTDFSLDSADKLVLLNLTYNQLTSFSLSHMKALAFLNLSNNKLSRFLSCDLPSATNINLSHNSLFHLSPNCISALNTHQCITLDLRNNALSNEGRTQIQENLLQRSGSNVTYYPILHPLIEHINNNTMTYQDFIDLLFRHNIFPSSENYCLKCPITHGNPRKVIFLMSSNKCYQIYDADALIQWIHTQSQSKTFSEEIPNPYTKESLTLHNIIKAIEPHVLKYLKQEIEPLSTENTDTIHDHKS